MFKLMIENAVFFAVAALVVFLLVVYSYYKLRDFKALVAYINTNQAFKDWRGFLGRALLIVLLLTVLTFALNSNANATESPDFFAYGQVSIGVDNVYNGDKSPACKDDGLNARLTSSGKVSINLVSWFGTELNASYQHHSCVLNGDDETYDAIGIEIIKRWDF